MARCIYCDAEANSKEDWLPRGLGTIRNITLLKDRLCANCNTSLGRDIDIDLLRTGPTGVFRSMLNIEGRHGDSPNPFHYKVLGPISATSMTKKAPFGDHQILCEPYKDKDGKTYVRPLRQLVFRKSDGSVVPIPFPPSYDSARLAKLFAERNVVGKELFEIYLGPGESKDDVAFRQVLQKVVGTVSDVKVYYGSVKGEMKEHAQLEAGLSAAYIRAVAKVAFHYHLWTSTADTGAEFHYRPIRQFIRHGEGDSRQFVEVSGPQFIDELKDGKVPALFSHFFGVTKVGNQLLGLVQFFVGPEHMTPPALVHLAQTRRYFPNQAHWVAYYGEKVKGYDGEIKELKIRG